jgi:hypothetical protein
MKTGIKRMAAVICVLFICLVATGYVWAYYSDADLSDNHISIGSVETEITEEFPDPVIPKDGGTLVKKVSVKNTAKSSCYVRVQVLFSDEAAGKKCTIDYNSDDWSYKDGWWYYLSPLGSGDSTSDLFSSVTFAAGASDLSGFSIYIRQESRQSATYENAFEPWKMEA